MNVILAALLASVLAAPATAGATPPCHEETPVCGAPGAEEAAPAPIAFDAPPPVGTRARCPVLKGEFTVTESTLRSEHAGKHYVFCCPGCKPRFDADPGSFLEE